MSAWSTRSVSRQSRPSALPTRPRSSWGEGGSSPDQTSTEWRSARRSSAVPGRRRVTATAATEGHSPGQRDASDFRAPPAGTRNAMESADTQFEPVEEGEAEETPDEFAEDIENDPSRNPDDP